MSLSSALFLLVLICLSNFIKCGGNKKHKTHIKVVVPEIIKHHHHTKIVFVHHHKPHGHKHGHKHEHGHGHGHGHKPDHKHEHKPGPKHEHKPGHKHEHTYKTFNHKHKTHHHTETTLANPYKAVHHSAPIRSIKPAKYSLPRNQQKPHSVKYTKTTYEPYVQHYQNDDFKADHFNDEHFNDDLFKQHYGTDPFKEQYSFEQYTKKNQDAYDPFTEDFQNGKNLKQNIKAVKSHHLEVETFTPDNPPFKYVKGGYEVEEENPDKVVGFGRYYSSPVRNEAYTPNPDADVQNLQKENEGNTPEYYNSEDYSFPKQDIQDYDSPSGQYENSGDSYGPHFDSPSEHYENDRDNYGPKSITFEEFVKAIDEEASKYSQEYVPPP